MKSIMNCVAFAILLFSASWAYGSDVEEVIVVGSKVTYTYNDPEYEASAIEALDATRVFQPGGLGGFVGMTMNGTDVKHTAVYRNGIPVNDAGNGWYDFGTELPMFQSYTIISGPNSSLYGSSSMGGTILIEDQFDGKNVFTKLGNDIYYITGGNDFLQVAKYRGSNGSVKTNNTETDWFENTTVKTAIDFSENWKLNYSGQDYDYDYDGCWDSSFNEVNVCNQEGQKHDVSIRGDWITIGYTRNDAKFYTEGVETWAAVSERYFLDVNGEVYDNLVIGLQGNREEYGANWDEHLAGYLNYTIPLEDFSNIGIGYRFEEDENVFRLGYESGLFRIVAANSFRKPNLFERYGGEFTFSNPNINPEKGKGIEVGYDYLSVWYYEFSEGIEYDFSGNQYINTGEYSSKGIKLDDYVMTDHGNFGYLLVYQDSDKIRIPRKKAKLSYFDGNDEFDYTISWVGQWDRGNDFDGSPIDDVNTVQINFGYWVNANSRLSLMISDLLDKEFEILPGYGAGGRTITLSFNLTR